MSMSVISFDSNSEIGTPVSSRPATPVENVASPPVLAPVFIPDSVQPSSMSTNPITQPGLILKSFIPILLELKDHLVVRDNKYYLFGAVDNNAWKSLQMLARQVEELDISLPDLDDNKSMIADPTYFRLGQLQGEQSPLLPALHRLTINNAKNLLSFIQLFLSPSLQSITLKNLPYDAGQTFVSFLTTETLRSLTRLTLDSFNLSSLAPAIAQCNNLEFLELKNPADPPSYASLEDVISLPMLKELRIDIGYAYQPHVNPGTTSPGSPNTRIGRRFDNLQLIGPLSMVMDVISATGADTIYSMDLNINGGITTSSHLSTLIETIATTQACNLQNLNLLISDQRLDGSFDQIPAIMGMFCNIQRLEISGFNFQNLDEHLPQMAAKWPHIKHLSLPLPYEHQGYAISLSTLKFVGQTCPDLIFFQVGIILPTNVDDFRPLGKFSDCILSHGLRTLSVGSLLGYYHYNFTMPPQVAHALARYLYAMFPDLENICTHPEFMAAPWEDVAELVKLCGVLLQESREIDRMRRG